jgi:hypothetical protein
MELPRNGRKGQTHEQETKKEVGEKDIKKMEEQ